MVGFAGEGQPASACVAADCGPRVLFHTAPGHLSYLGGLGQGTVKDSLHRGECVDAFFIQHREIGRTREGKEPPVAKLDCTVSRSRASRGNLPHAPTSTLPKDGLATSNIIFQIPLGNSSNVGRTFHVSLETFEIPCLFGTSKAIPSYNRYLTTPILSASLPQTTSTQPLRQLKYLSPNSSKFNILFFFLLFIQPYYLSYSSSSSASGIAPWGLRRANSTSSF
ncbi:uncharacterized protein CLUP02_04304 [Colletotrichum lupini]|uniref:Uncharacterized protein n=1 Tax=Colletotrichum lupini TaxID=145971 RepID=A0A9Q8SLV0_9PEZI|nr:uncharacterized protein CLUP02_04304 [Colletotrichum lupini]UQC78827.1 hypothetical protein CLUP02_04304 [Colletotrichum lupini]